MRLRLSLSSAVGCVVLSLLFVGTAAQDVRVNFGVDPALGAYSTDDDTSLNVGLVAPGLSKVSFTGDIIVTVRASPPSDPALRAAKLVDSLSSLPGDYTLLDLKDLSSLPPGSVDTFDVTFSSGSDFSSNFTIEIIPDNIYEGIEYFTLEIVGIKEPDGFPANLQFGTRSKVTVTVLDTDVLTIAFTERAVELKEGDLVQLEGVTAENPFSVEVEVGVQCLELIGTGARPATRDEDFKIARNATLRFTDVDQMPPIMSSTNPSVSIEQDGLVEGTEAFLCVLTISVSPGQPLQSSDPDTITLTILDIDELEVEWNRADYLVTEGDGEVLVELVARGRYAIAFFLQGEPQVAESTMVGGRDHGLAVASSGDLTGDFIPNIVSFDFPANVASPTLVSGMTFQVVDDDILEEDEVFEGVFAIPVQVSNQINIKRGAAQVTSIIIRDNDVVEVSFAEDSYRVTESSGNVSLQLRVDGRYNIDFQVVVECRDSNPVSAEAGADYMAVTHTVNVSRPSVPLASSFEENLPNVTFTDPVAVTIFSDGVLEDSEVFECHIVSTSHSRVRAGSGRSVPITIVDQDSVSVHFSSEHYLVSESSGPALLELVVVGMAAIPVTVSAGTLNLLNTSVGMEATAVADYIPVNSQAIVFQPGQTRQPFTVDIVVDQLPELSEFFNAVINTSQPRVLLPSPSLALVEIIDDDSFVTISFDAVSYDVIEGHMMVQVCVSLSAAYFESVSVSLQPKAIPGDPAVVATMTDFMATPSTLTIPANSTSGCAIVIVMDDTLVEVDEEFNVHLTYTDNQQGVSLGSAAVATITIINDDALQLTFERSQYNTSEGTMLAVMVTASGMSSFDYNFTVAPSDLTAQEGDDYVIQTRSFTYIGGTSGLDFPVVVDVLADGTFEGREQFELTLSIDQTFQDLGVAYGNPNRTTVTIDETDVLGVSLGVSTLTVIEGGDVALTVEANNTFQYPFNVTVQLAPGTAADPEDFVGGSFLVTLDPAQQGGMLVISALRDNILELPETLSATLLPPTTPGVVAMEPTSATVTILDATMATVMFSSPMVGVTEGDTVTLQLVLSAEVAPDVSFSVNLTTTPGTATAMVDYIPTIPPVHFMGTNMTAVQVHTTNDSVVEDTEDFTVHLVLTQGAAGLGISLGDPNTTVVEINDNDVAKVFFTQSLYTVSESNGSVLVTVVTSKPHSEAFEVIVKATSGSAQPLLDFVFTDETVTFPPGEVSATVVVFITEDLIMEVTESFSLFLEVPQVTADQKVTAGVPAEATINILDNDSMRVSLTSPSMVTEGDSVTVTVVTDGEFSFPINVTLTLVDGTATGGVDFDVSGFPMTVTLFPDMTSVTVTVSTTTDGVIECPENFEASLTIPTSSLDVRVELGSPATVSITIVDADAPLQVSFEDITYNATEGTMATITLVTNTPNYTFPFTVSLVYSDTTATVSVDYSPLPQSVSFAAGQGRLSFEVEVLEDQVLEQDELFSVSVGSFSGECPSALVTALDRDTATVTIINDDTVTVSLMGPAVVTEGDNVTVTVVSDGEFSFPISVTLTLVDGTATGGVDFDVSGFPMIVTLFPDMTSVTVTVSTTADGVIECSECFEAVLGAPSNGVVLGSTTTVNTCIVDASDGKLEVSFSVVEYDTTEGTAARITMETNTPNYSFPFTVFLEYLDLNGISAVKGVDYTPLPTNVTFAAGQQRVTFMVDVPDDQVAELPESFRVSITGYDEELSCADGLVVGGGLTTAFVTIQDNDELIVSLIPDVYSVREGGNVTVTLVTNIPYAFEFTISVEGVNVTATAGEDFDGGPQSVIFRASVTSPSSATVTFQTHTDNVYEGEEVFLVMLTGERSVGVGSERVLVEIVDQTMVKVTFSQSNYRVTEGDNVTVTLDSNVDIQKSFEVNVSTAGVTAEAGADFTALTDVVVTFENGSSVVSVTIVTIDDNVFEADETLDVTFVIPSTAVNIVTGTIATAQVLIDDNDALSIQFERPTYQVGEGDGMLEVAVVTNIPTGFNFTVFITVMDGTATALTDFNITGFLVPVQQNRLFIGIGSTRNTFNVTIIEDFTFEGNETFTLTLSAVSVSGITVAMPDVAMVTIIDNEPMVTVTLEAQDYRVVEGVGFVEVCLVKSGLSTNSLTLMCVGQEVDPSSNLIGSGTIVDMATGDEDFQEAAQILMIAPNETRACFNVTIINDNLVELEELFQALITTVPGQEGVESGEFEPVEFEPIIRIIDDDDIKVTFQQPSYTVSESVGMVTIRVVASNNASFSYDVRVTSANLTANDPSDFKFDPITLTFNPGETSQEFTVSIEDDKANLEPNEQFVLTLVVISLTGSSSGERENTTVTITDDKVVTVTFDPTMYTTNEGVLLNVTLKASIPSVTPYSVVVVNDDNTAKAPDDYSPIGPYTVTFPSGVTMATISLLIADDDLAEESERFNLKISSISDSRVVTGRENVTTVTILDGDKPTVNFQPTTYNVSEGAEVQLISILDKDPARTFTVDVETIDGTASPPHDYTGGIFTFTFFPGSRTATVNVSVNRDDIVEGDPEHFTAVLRPGDGSVAIGTKDTAFVTIFDETEADVTFDPVNYTVNEGDTVNLTLKVNMAELVTSVTVTVVTVPMTAGNDDFVSGNYSVTFGPGDMTASLFIRTHNDILEEKTEVFQVVILSTTLQNVKVGAANMSTVAITDTTVLYPVSFERAVYTVSEGKEAKVMLIIEGGEVAGDLIRVNVAVNDGTARDGEDYDDGTTIANILEGTRETTIIIQTKMDEVLEMTENFTLHIGDPGGFAVEGGHVVLGSIPVAVVQITEASNLNLSYNSTDYTVREDDGPLEVVLMASRSASFEYSVIVTPTAVSANADEDFDPQPLTAVFAPGQRVASVFLDIVDNALVELDEGLTLQMEVSQDLNNKGVTIEGNGQATVTILDNDVEVLFDQIAYTANETEGYVTLTIRAQGDTSQGFTVTVNTVDGTATSQSDFTPGPYTTEFVRKQTQTDIRVLISNDGVFEGPETFVVTLTLSSADTHRATTVHPSEAEVTIFDGSGMQGVLLRVNDTIVGDPLYTVPLQGLNLTAFPELDGVSLCYEFHGFSGRYYSVVSDACTTVNAHYAAGKSDARLNIVSEIGVKAQGQNGTCHQINVTLDQCQASVDGQPVSTMYSADDVVVMSQRDRVRVEVPNCDFSRRLVMWVLCEQRNGEDMIRFVISRGQGLTPTSHGLVAQFWNIPMEYKRYSGLFGGRMVTEEAGLYEVTVRYPGSPPRTFIGDLEQLTWEQNRQPCLYAGNSYAGRVSEAIAFDSVIEGEHTDYEVADIFNHDFTFDKYNSVC